MVLHPGIGINGITEDTHPKLEVGVPPVREALNGDERSMVPLGTVLQALEVCVGIPVPALGVPDIVGIDVILDLTHEEVEP